MIDDASMRDGFVVCHNPDEAARDKQVRDGLLQQIAEATDGSDKLSGAAQGSTASFAPSASCVPPSADYAFDGERARAMHADR